MAYFSVKKTEKPVSMVTTEREILKRNNANDSTISFKKNCTLLCP
jgi:hypothetical protein